MNIFLSHNLNRPLTRAWLSACLLVMLTACSVNQAERGESLPSNAHWALLPFINYSQTPQAGERSERLVLTLLRREGLTSIRAYPPVIEAHGLPVLNEQRRYKQALEWARQSGTEYAVSGSVEEWRYKSGLDGEPAVGISLQIIDVNSGDVIWSGSGARAGWSRESLSGTAQKVLAKLSADLPLN